MGEVTTPRPMLDEERREFAGVFLTGQQFALVAVLYRSMPAPVPHARIAKALFGIEEDSRSSRMTTRSTLARLRRLLPAFVRIVPLFGHGYRMEIGRVLPCAACGGTGFREGT